MGDTWTGAAYRDEPDDWCIVLFRSVEGEKRLYVCMHAANNVYFFFKPAFDNCLCDVAQ